MKYKSAEEFRDVEIRLLYDSILKKGIRDGLSFKNAREAAFDAISLRFTLSRSRARIIVNAQTKTTPSSKIGMLIAQTESLIECMKIENEYMQKEIARNNELIEILQYVNENYRRY